MKDEIKEILEEMIDNEKLINVENDYEIIIFEYLANNCSEFDDEHIKQLANLKVEQYKQLLDCITNLQEYYNDIVNKYEDLIVKYSNLQEENERLKEELLQEKKDFKEANDYCFELKDYKQRNEKAIEKLESIRIFGLRSGKTLFSTLINESIDILKGDKDE